MEKQDLKGPFYLNELVEIYISGEQIIKYRNFLQNILFFKVSEVSWERVFIVKKTKFSKKTILVSNLNYRVNKYKIPPNTKLFVYIERWKLEKLKLNNFFDS